VPVSEWCEGRELTHLTDVTTLEGIEVMRMLRNRQCILLSTGVLPKCGSSTNSSEFMPDSSLQLFATEPHYESWKCGVMVLQG
jgi:hypothetical protein